MSVLYFGLNCCVYWHYSVLGLFITQDELCQFLALLEAAFWFYFLLHSILHTTPRLNFPCQIQNVSKSISLCLRFQL